MSWAHHLAQVFERYNVKTVGGYTKLALKVPGQPDVMVTATSGLKTFFKEWKKLVAGHPASEFQHYLAVMRPIATACYVADSELAGIVAFRLFKCLELRLSATAVTLEDGATWQLKEAVEAGLTYLRERCSFVIEKSSAAKLAYNACMTTYHAARLFDLVYLFDLENPIEAEAAFLSLNFLKGELDLPVDRRRSRGSQGPAGCYAAWKTARRGGAGREPLLCRSAVNRVAQRHSRPSGAVIPVLGQ